MRTHGCQLTRAFGVSEHVRVHLLPFHMELPGVQALDDVAHVCSEFLQRGCGCMAFCSQRHLRGLRSGAAGRWGETGQSCHHPLCNTVLKETSGNARTPLPLPIFIPTIPILHIQCQMFSPKATNHSTAWYNPRLNSLGAEFPRSGWMEEKLTQKISRSFCYMFFL